MWVLFLFVCLSALIAQLTEVSLAYFADNTGTILNRYVPPSFPSLWICPRFPWMRPDVGVSRELFDVIQGYYIQSYATEQAGYVYNIFPDVPSTFESVNKSKAPEAEEFVKGYGYDLKFVAENTSFAIDDIILRKAGFPVGTLKMRKVVNMAGPCYEVALTNKIDEDTAENTVIQVMLKDDMGFGWKEVPLYWLYLGDIDTNGVQMDISSWIGIKKHHRYTIKARAHKNVHYKGRLGQQCKEYSTSGKRHCRYSRMNSLLCGNQCKVFVPQSSKYDQYCNIAIQMPCIYFASYDITLQQKVYTECPKECVEKFYDVVVQSSETNTTGVHVAMDRIGFSIQVREYPLVTLADYMSSLGGTASFWFGASVVSLFQICVTASRKGIKIWARKRVHGGERSGERESSDSEVWAS